MDQEMSLKPISVKLNWLERLIGMLTVIIAYIAVRCLSLSTISRLVGVLKRRCSNEISMNEADIVWGAVRQSSFFFLGRAACLELSLAFVLFALTKGRSATWCIGVATEPLRSHSWVELAGKPFREDGCVEKDFKKMLAV